MIPLDLIKIRLKLKQDFKNKLRFKIRLKLKQDFKNKLRLK